MDFQEIVETFSVVVPETVLENLFKEKMIDEGGLRPDQNILLLDMIKDESTGEWTIRFYITEGRYDA